MRTLLLYLRVKLLHWSGFVTPLDEMHAILVEQATNCPACHGTGAIPTLGATLKCVRCLRIRRVLRSVSAYRA